MAMTATSPTIPTGAPDYWPAEAPGLELPPAEPGTGPDWRAALPPTSGPDLVPAPPRSLELRRMERIPGTAVPTDRESLAYAEARQDGGDPGQVFYARAEAERIRKQAAAGFHDGSLPELGHYRPVYFVPAAEVASDAR